MIRAKHKKEHGARKTHCELASEFVKGGIHSKYNPDGSPCVVGLHHQHSSGTNYIADDGTPKQTQGLLMGKGQSSDSYHPVSVDNIRFKIKESLAPSSQFTLGM